MDEDAIDIRQVLPQRYPLWVIVLERGGWQDKDSAEEVRRFLWSNVEDPRSVIPYPDPVLGWVLNPDGDGLVAILPSGLSRPSAFFDHVYGPTPEATWEAARYAMREADKIVQERIDALEAQAAKIVPTGERRDS